LADRIGIIGAGPAGIMAALLASNQDKKVIIIDSNQNIGRKLLVTGAGRCNITNRNCTPKSYFSRSEEGIESVLAQFSHQDLLNFLLSIGIPTYQTDDGWFYPISNSAANVVTAFDAQLDLHFIQKELGKTVQNIQLDSDGKFLLSTNQDQIIVEKLIIATGGKAYPDLGSTGSIFPILKQLGHTILPIFPALAPIITNTKPIKDVQGVRVDVEVSLLENNCIVAKNFGNVIFTKWGLNGPGVMNISHLVKNAHKHQSISINFLHHQEKTFFNILNTYRSSSLPLIIIVQSLLPTKLARSLVLQSGLSPLQPVASIKKNELEKLLSILKDFRLNIQGIRDFEFAQVSTGGIPFDEVDHQTLESRIIRNLFFAGEVLDVTGPCGGYNLQWGFSSGAVAGMHAAS
jgi:predicted Rossmann fold flavoprotein